MGKAKGIEDVTVVKRIKSIESLQIEKYVVDGM